MKVNFEFEDKDIKVNFENNYKLKDQTTEKGIKVLMLKGEKGDPGIGGAEWGGITGTLSEQIDLKNALDKKADKTDIPTKTSQLENDSGFLTQHQDLTNYAKKEDIPDVSNFITKSINDLENYYLKSETYTQTEVDTKLNTKANSSNVYTKTEIDTKLGTKQDELTAGTNITISNNTISAKNTTYTNATSKSDGLMSKEDKSKIDNILKLVYPVGSIYISVNSTNPANLFGGKWEQIKDRFLLACGSTYKAGATGGEATHRLTQNEIPNYSIGTIPEAVSFNHNNWNNGGITNGDLGKASSSKKGVANNNDVLTIVSDTQWGYKISTNGGNQPHNNMPPYLAVYMWKRTA